MFLAALGTRIAQARTRANISQRQLSAVRGYSFGWLQKIESGENQISVLDLVRIAEYLGVSVEDLLGGGTTFRPQTRSDFRVLFAPPQVADTLHTLYLALVSKSEGEVEHPNRTTKEGR